MAPSTGSDVGQLAADLVFFGDRADARPDRDSATARRTMAVVRQNFALAIGYNVLAGASSPLPALVTPLIAALAMSGSSLLVVANRPAPAACRPVNGLALLIPLALGLGLAALAAFFWTVRSGQFDDLDGAALRILIEERRGRHRR